MKLSTKSIGFCVCFRKKAGDKEGSDEDDNSKDSTQLDKVGLDHCNTTVFFCLYATISNMKIKCQCVGCDYTEVCQWSRRCSQWHCLGANY
jgi:hypothetical protein